MAAVYKTYWVDMPYCVFVWDVFLTTDGYFFRHLTVKSPLRPSGNIKGDHVVFENKFNNEHRDNFPMSAVLPTLIFFSVLPIKNTIENYQFPIRTPLGIAPSIRNRFPYCSGYHVRFTRGRSLLPARPETKLMIFVFRWDYNLLPNSRRLWKF